MKNNEDIKELTNQLQNLETFEQKSNLFNTSLLEFEKNIKNLQESLEKCTIIDKQDFEKQHQDFSIILSQLELLYKTYIKVEKNKCVGLIACTKVSETLEDLEDKLDDLDDLLDDIEEEIEESIEKTTILDDSEEDFEQFEKEKELEETLVEANGVQLKGIALIDEKTLKYLKKFESNLAIPKNLEGIKYYVVLVKLNKYNYCIPISFKEYITKSNKNQGVTFTNIYNENNQHIVTFKYNNMFPTSEYKMVDINLEENEKYNEILQYTKNDFENISKKIIKIYKIAKNEIEVNESLRSLINNFGLLEAMLRVKKETSKALNIANNVLNNLFKKKR